MKLDPLRFAAQSYGDPIRPAHEAGFIGGRKEEPQKRKNKIKKYLHTAKVAKILRFCGGVEVM